MMQNVTLSQAVVPCLLHVWKSLCQPNMSPWHFARMRETRRDGQTSGWIKQATH